MDRPSKVKQNAKTESMVPTGLAVLATSSIWNQQHHRPFDVLEECLMRKYFELLPICGICRSVSREIRQMDRGFYGIGSPHPGVECMISQINKLLTHYGSSLGLGIHMQASKELLVTEGGVSTQILAEPFAR
jgi:hypothetical protein